MPHHSLGDGAYTDDSSEGDSYTDDTPDYSADDSYSDDSYTDDTTTYDEDTGGVTDYSDGE